MNFVVSFFRSSVTLSPPSFHAKKGQLVTLTQTYKTATRNHATQEFNHGLVLSSFPLQDNQIFEVVNSSCFTGGGGEGSIHQRSYLKISEKHLYNLWIDEPSTVCGNREMDQLYMTSQVSSNKADDIFSH